MWGDGEKSGRRSLEVEFGRETKGRPYSRCTAENDFFAVPLAKSCLRTFRSLLRVSDLPQQITSFGTVVYLGFLRFASVRPPVGVVHLRCDRPCFRQEVWKATRK